MSPVANFELSDFRVMPLGSGYCQERWRLYRKWEMELNRAKVSRDASPRRAYRAMVQHMSTCDDCLRHARRMNTLASQVVYPEVELPEWY
jgi:hypothetical protein